MELIGLHHPFHWEFVRFSWFYTYWIIWNGILGILNIVIRLWVMFKSSGDIWVLLFALPANGRKSFRMYILTCLLWAMVLMSVQFLKTLQCSSGLFCESFCFPVWQQGNIYLPQEFIYRRTERKKKTHIGDVAHTLQRVSLKTEMFPPSKCSQIPLHHFHGAAATVGGPSGEMGFSLFSLSLLLSIPQIRMTVFPWSSRPVFVWSIISGSTLPWGPNWELWEAKKNRGREERNSPPDPPCLDLFVPSPLCLLPFVFWTLQVAALCTLFMFWFHPVGEKE